VVIVNSMVAGPDDLVVANPGARVRLRQITALGGAGRFFWGRSVAEVVIRNSTILNTTGIRLDRSEDGARVLVTQNRARNIQHADYNTVFFQAADVQDARIDVSWNEVINVFGRSGVEDIVSIYHSANASIHDNYLQGAYPEGDASEGFSGSGVMIEGEDSHHNAVYRNQIVETTNVGIGIAGGHHNRIHDNRLVFDGRLWDGTRLAAANVGFAVWNLDDDDEFSANDAYRNTVGWIAARGGRNDWWLPDCTGICSNTRLRGRLSRDRELVEFSIWTKKLAANGMKVGRTTKPTGG
jgi:hypothetical protein